jgi:hypothetical protein
MQKQTQKGFLRWWTLLSVAAAIGWAGCSSDANKKMDSGTDGAGAKDGGGDTTPGDAASDTAADVAIDTAPDVPVDTRADVPADTGTDVAGDAPSDGNADGPKDGGIDVPPPTMLTATVLDRRQTSFQLVWPAPAAAGGGAVAGYDIRVAKVPITSANFDDTAVTKTVTYGTTPAAPGAADSAVASGLAIEQPYYFAVVGKEANGTRGAIMTTATPVTATFLTTVLTGGATDGIGTDVAGWGDFGGSNRAFAGDGFSDLIVGNTGGTHVFIYFGSSTGYPSTPSVTITSTVANFGQAVTDAGDIDGDGLDDIAIVSPSDANGKVFIFSRKSPPASWGSTTSWPATLTDTQANYTLTVDPTFAGVTNPIARRALSPLGNFDGTGADDLAVGIRMHGSSLGAVVVVKGGTSFASMTIPDPANTKTIQIEGTVASGQFGGSVLGIGPFFASPAGPALVAGAPPARAIYAFKGQAPAAALTADNADDSTVGTATDQYGINLGFLGQLGGSAGALSVASTMGKYVDVHLGTAATGPFLGAAGSAPSASVRFVDVASGNSFGILNIGGGIKGSSRTVSIIGSDAVPDLILAGQGETGTPIYVVSGAAIPSLTGMVDVTAVQPEVVPSIVKISAHLPSDWIGYATGSVIVDSNKDGYADFAVGESTSNMPGRVVVFY